jgi:tRNA (guanine-N7-)-methyltransferase
LRIARPEEHRSQVEAWQGELRASLAALDLPGRRLVWEVGSGHGHFLTAYARAHPADTCIGVDLMSDRVKRAERKRERARLANLHFLRGDAADFLAVMPAEARFAAVFVLFPDPWPKRRHHKNRVLTADFLTAVAARAPQGTPLHFRTDHEPYFRSVASLVRAHPDWNEAPASAWSFEETTVFQQRAPEHFTLVARRN